MGTHTCRYLSLLCRYLYYFMSRFCDELKPTGHTQLLIPYLSHYIQQLAAMSGEFPEDVVVMVTEALQLVIQVHVHVYL